MNFVSLSSTANGDGEIFYGPAHKSQLSRSDRTSAGSVQGLLALGVITQSPTPNRFARFGFGPAGSRARLSICPIPLLHWSRTYHSRLQTPPAGGKKRPSLDNTQAHPFDIPPVGVTLSVMHTMYRLLLQTHHLLVSVRVRMEF